MVPIAAIAWVQLLAQEHLYTMGVAKKKKKKKKKKKERERARDLGFSPTNAINLG